MIAQFTVENFRSFKEKQTFSLVSTKDKELSESNTFQADKKLRFLRSAVVYGANASGKSNFFNALVFFFRFSVYSGPHYQVGEPIKIEPFALSKQTENAPSHFEIIFIINDESGETRYRYGFSVNKEHVVKEYLYAINNVREVTLFERNFQKIDCTSYFKEGSRVKSSVRNNCSFLSVCAQNNVKIATQIIEYFNKIYVFLPSSSPYIPSPRESKIEYKRIVEFLKYCSIQITDIKHEAQTSNIDDLGFLFNEPEVKAFIEHMKKKHPTPTEIITIYYGHQMYDGDNAAGIKYFPDNYESDGTRKISSFSFYILDALKNGTPIFIDEFDNSLHPLIIELIIKLFNSPITNPKNAQLIISCHAINIMNNKLFRRDQIWFCEKDQYEATDLYSLVEYKKPVRNDASYNKNYLHGKYGAIPYINDILHQVGNEDE